MVAAVVFLIIAFLQLIFPGIFWGFGTSNMINDGSNGWEDIRSITSLAKKHPLIVVRISGGIFLIIGIGLLLRVV